MLLSQNVRTFLENNPRQLNKVLQVYENSQIYEIYAEHYDEIFIIFTLKCMSDYITYCHHTRSLVYLF